MLSERRDEIKELSPATAEIVTELIPFVAS